ncbi:SRPBCC family protein [Streptomyces sp. NPDC007074]|uniref:SRPBCC family protein n=1 Tax=Streptomyces sp. NPDC007074 TaxID=3156764 RepID=UPI0033CD4060
MSSRVHAGEDAVEVAAPAGVVYGLLADAVRWPVFLPSLVHVERLDFDGTQERLLVWEVAAQAGAPGGHVRSRHIRRVLRPHERSVVFEEEEQARPGLVTSGVWTVRPAGEDRCVLGLRQERVLPLLTAAGDSRVRDEDTGGVRRRLGEVRAAAERWEELDELLLSFEDRIRVEGPAELVYDFLYRVEDWEERLPHVEGARVREDSPGVQVVLVDTCAPEGGASLTTGAVRLCFPHAGRIVYKETLLPPLLAAHSGEWSLLPDAVGVTVVAAHRVMLRPDAVARELGAGTSLLEARRQVHGRLSRADRQALGLAKWHAESTVRRLR